MAAKRLVLGLVPLALLFTAGCTSSTDGDAKDASKDLPSASQEATTAPAPSEITADSLGGFLLTGFHGATTLTEISADMSIDDGVDKIQQAESDFRDASTGLSGKPAEGIPADKVAKAADLTGQMADLLSTFGDCLDDADSTSDADKCAEGPDDLNTVASDTGEALGDLVAYSNLTDDQVSAALTY
jgi:hypothetical protein